jgi:uncharacterized protein with HEPN domain
VQKKSRPTICSIRVNFYYEISYYIWYAIIFLHQSLLECIDKINSYTSSGENEFSKSTLLQDAVMRNLEIIGEATKNISLDLRRKHPQIPWRKMGGLRDILIHN